MSTPPDNGPKRGPPGIPPVAKPAAPSAAPLGAPSGAPPRTGSVPAIAPVVPPAGPPLGSPAGSPRGTGSVPAIAPAIAPAIPPLGAPSGAPRRTGSAPAMPAIAPSIAPAIAPLGAPSGAPPRTGSAPAMPAIAPVATPIPTPVPSIPTVELSPDAMTAEQTQALFSFAQGLDRLDYFQVLKLTPTALPTEVKKAFYRESRTYHPDRFFHLSAGEVKQAVNTIYKRITEAYAVLREDPKRQKYLADINGPERASKLRYTEATESELKAEVKKAQDEVYGTNPKARQFYKTALSDLDKGALQAAERNLKSALTFEPSNGSFKEKLAEIQQRIEGERKTGGEKDAFRIK